MKIAIASDHKGYKLKQELLNHLEKEYEVIDLGTNSEESTDFPKYGILLGETVIKDNLDLGIAICGTGIGISIAANKVKGIMCAKISTKEEAIEMIETFINSTLLIDEKYQRRINQIKEYENAN